MVERPVEITDDVVDRAKAGDEVAFTDIVRAHQHEVFSLAYRLLGNYELASDAAQETFVRAWKALPKFRGDAALGTWLHRIAVNTSWTVGRRATRHKTRRLEDSVAIVDDTAPDPVAVAENRELRSDLKTAISKLPLAQRAVVVLKDVYGWTHDEVAGELGITVTAAKVRLHRGRKRLQRSLWGDK